jgi:hypothetical protein
MGSFRKRGRNESGGDAETAYPYVPILVSTRWKFSRLMAGVGLIVLFAGVLLIVLGREWGIGKKLISCLPGPLRGYFQSSGY